MADSARPRVLAVLPGFYPSTIIGVAKPLQRIHLQGRITLDLSLQVLAGRAAIERAEVVVMCGEAHPRCRQILEWIRDADRPLVYELDDNRIEVPPEIPGLAYARDPVQRDMVIACIRQADAVRVYSPSLQALVRQYNPNVTLVGGPLDWDLIPAVPRVRDAARVRMVYATSRQQDRIARMVVEPLRRALDAFPQTELTIWGPSVGELERHPRVRHLPFVRDYDRFFRRFAGEGFDIGLAPLPDDAFHRGKSNNKFREYAACGVAGIYSDMPVYNTCVVHGSTGLLAQDRHESWFDALAQLIGNAEVRQGIADNARRFARDRYNPEATDAAWISAINEWATRPRRDAVRTLPTSPSPAGPLTTIARLLTHAMQLGVKAVSVLSRYGIAAAHRRFVDHVTGVAQLVAWNIRRRRQRSG